MQLDTLKDLYIAELKDLYSAEKQIVKALPKMIKATKHPELKAAFKTHLQQTAEHAKRLELICEGAGRDSAREEMRRNGGPDRRKRAI